MAVMMGQEEAGEVVEGTFTCAACSEAYPIEDGIPLDTLAAWERHEAEPSEVELAYLKLIEREPELARVPQPVAAK